MAKIDQTSNDAKTICWARGDFDPKVFTIVDASGNPLDISGSTFILSVDSLKNPTDTMTQQFTAAGSFVTDGTDGKIQFQPADETETDITPDRYFYDIQEILGTGQKRTLIKAAALIIQDITKA